MIEVSGFRLQEQPPIYVAAIPGRWLLERTTPVWRIDDPEQGFQRAVRESRARAIALGVLDERRTFPNAIVLATDVQEFDQIEGKVLIPTEMKLLVVDGQHRLWAQKYSEFEADYACVIHTGLSEVDMARLFLEINDNQKRVPSSLRWDLVRLVRPDDDPVAIAAAEMVYALATEEDSPLFQRIDLTGEQKEIQLKQGSIAPEFRRIFTSRSPLYKYRFDQQEYIVTQFLLAVKESDRDQWISGTSNFLKARVLRALIRLLGDIALRLPIDSLNLDGFLPILGKIDTSTLDSDTIRALQGSAGVKAIYDQIKKQVDEN